MAWIILNILHLLFDYYLQEHAYIFTWGLYILKLAELKMVCIVSKYSMVLHLEVKKVCHMHYNYKAFNFLMHSLHNISMLEIYNSLITTEMWAFMDSIKT